jgi:hypothetical protein
MMIDFDDLDDWSPKLAEALHGYLPDSTEVALRTAAPPFTEDARDHLFDLAGRDPIISRTLDWIRSTAIVAYHGTRLNDMERVAVRSAGLLPLDPLARRDRLRRALSPSPRWHAVHARLDAIIEKYGQGQAGVRAGQVHLTLSRSGLTKSFNHYLTHGAEFDQQVARDLLGCEGERLLARDGEPTLIRVAVPGTDALAAAHPLFDIETLRARGDVPNLANQFLQAWSYRLAHPGFQSSSLLVDCGMRFESAVPANRILDVEVLQL